MVRGNYLRSDPFLRILLPVVLTVVLFVAMIFLVVLPYIEKSMMEQKRLMLKELVDTVHSCLGDCIRRQQDGEWSLEEARTHALEHVRNLRYGPEGKDYFWINDMRPYMVMHPYRPDLDGTDISDFKDPNGKRLFVEFVRTVEESGGGYVDYMWQWKDDPERIVPKISYVREFKPWGWIVGTGIYIEDVRAELASTRQRMVWICALILFVVTMLCVYIVREAHLINEQREEAEDLVRESEARYRTLVEHAPEAIVVFDPDSGRFLDANDNAEALFGLSRDELLRSTSADVSPPFQPDGRSSRDALLQFAARAFEGEPQIFEWTHVNKATGDNVFCEVRMVRLPSSKARLVRKSVVDITERKRAEIKLQETVREMTVLNALAKQVSSKLSLEQVVQEALNGVLDLVDADLALCMLRDGEELVLLGQQMAGGGHAVEARVVHRVGECLCGLAAKQGEAVFSSNINEDCRCTRGECKAGGFVSFAALPLLSGDSMLGVLGLATLEGRDFSEQATLLETASNEVATGLQNALLYDELEKRALALEQEISERKQAEEAVLRSERNYREIFNASNDAIFVHDAETGRLVDVNEAMLRMVRCTKEEALASGVKVMSSGIPPYTWENALRKIQLAVSEGPQTFEWQGRRRDGELFWTEVSLRHSQVGGSDRVLAVVRDITERKRAQEVMVQSEKMLSVGGLAAGMAHEINNPLAGMVQTAQVMRRRLTELDMPANLRAAEEAGIAMEALKGFMDARGILTMLRRVEESGVRAAEIVANMLSFARKSDSISSKHDIAELLDQCVELAGSDYNLKKMYDFRKIKIVREYADDVPPVPCEGAKIQQVFLNILRNGAEAMSGALGDSEKPEPTFVLRVMHDRDAGVVRVEIEDNGPGLDEATRKRVFEPFFTTKPTDKGTGLGLSVSYFIITENHGGEMVVASCEGVGTTFSICLPLERS